MLKDLLRMNAKLCDLMVCNLLKSLHLFCQTVLAVALIDWLVKDIDLSFTHILIYFLCLFVIEMGSDLIFIVFHTITHFRFLSIPPDNKD